MQILCRTNLSNEADGFPENEFRLTLQSTKESIVSSPIHCEACSQISSFQLEEWIVGSEARENLWSIFARDVGSINLKRVLSD